MDEKHKNQEEQRVSRRDVLSDNPLVRAALDAAKARGEFAEEEEQRRAQEEQPLTRRDALDIRLVFAELSNELEKEKPIEQEQRSWWQKITDSVLGPQGRRTMIGRAVGGVLSLLSGSGWKKAFGAVATEKPAETIMGLTEEIGDYFWHGVVEELQLITIRFRVLKGVKTTRQFEKPFKKLQEEALDIRKTISDMRVFFPALKRLRDRGELDEGDIPLEVLQESEEEGICQALGHLAAGRDIEKSVSYLSSRVNIAAALKRSEVRLNSFLERSTLDSPLEEQLPTEEELEEKQGVVSEQRAGDLLRKGFIDSWRHLYRAGGGGNDLAVDSYMVRLREQLYDAGNPAGRER